MAGYLTLDGVIHSVLSCTIQPVFVPNPKVRHWLLLYWKRFCILLQIVLFSYCVNFYKRNMDDFEKEKRDTI